MTPSALHTLDLLPKAYLESLKPLLQSKYPDFCNAMSLEAFRGLRFNANFKGYLSQRAQLEAVPWAENAYYISTGALFGAHPLHDAGAWYLQEPSAMAPVSALSPKESDLVLDLCAAPGGKSIQLAARLKNACLVANEPHRKRAEILSRNIERMGFSNTVVVSESPERLADAWPNHFDCILVDAPCSGEGMFRRDPETISQWRPDSARGCAERQLSIMRSATKLLRLGGKLCYSTCTFNETENENLIRAFLKEHPSFSLKTFYLPGLPVAERGYLRIWPHENKGEGQFICLLQENSEAVSLKRETFLAKARIDQSLIQSFNRHLKAWLQEEIEANLLFQNHFVLCPPLCPNLKGIKVLRCGLHLADAQSKDPRPDHALALAYSFKQNLICTLQEASLFQQGNPLPCSESLKGYVSLSLEGRLIGFGKCSEGLLKNHYPKGLRRNENWGRNPLLNNPDEIT